MSQPKSQWQRTRHTQQVMRRERKQRAMKKNYKPRTTGRHVDTFSQTMQRRISRGNLLKVLGFAPDGYDVQSVRTRQRQKKVA